MFYNNGCYVYYPSGELLCTEPTAWLAERTVAKLNKLWGNK